MGLASVYPHTHAPCGLRGCKNGPNPFPGRMSYKATKPGLAVCHILECFFIVLLLFIRAPFLCIVVFIAQGPRLQNDLYCVEWDVKL